MVSIIIIYKLQFKSTQKIILTRTIYLNRLKIFDDYFLALQISAQAHFNESIFDLLMRTFISVPFFRQYENFLNNLITLKKIFNILCSLSHPTISKLKKFFNGKDFLLFCQLYLCITSFQIYLHNLIMAKGFSCFKMLQLTSFTHTK